MSAACVLFTRDQQLDRLNLEIKISSNGQAGGISGLQALRQWYTRLFLVISSNTVSAITDTRRRLLPRWWINRREQK